MSQATNIQGYSDEMEFDPSFEDEIGDDYEYGEMEELEDFEEVDLEKAGILSEHSRVSLKEIRELEEKISSSKNIPNVDELLKILDEAEQHEIQAGRSERFTASVTQMKRARELHEKAQEAYEQVSESIDGDLFSEDEETTENSRADKTENDEASYHSKSELFFRPTFGKIKTHDIRIPRNGKITIKVPDYLSTAEILGEQPSVGKTTIKIHRDGSNKSADTETFIVDTAELKSKNIILEGIKDPKTQVTYNEESYVGGSLPSLTVVGEIRNAPPDLRLDRIRAALKTDDDDSERATTLLFGIEQAFKTGDWSVANSALNGLEAKYANDAIVFLTNAVIGSFAVPKDMNEQETVQCFSEYFQNGTGRYNPQAGKAGAKEWFSRLDVNFRKKLISSAMEEATRLNPPSNPILDWSLLGFCSSPAEAIQLISSSIETYEGEEIEIPESEPKAEPPQ